MAYIGFMHTHTDLKQLIDKRGYKISFVAKHVGISAQTLRLIVGGHRKTSRPVIKLLAQVLDVSEQELEDMGLLHKEAS